MNNIAAGAKGNPPLRPYSDVYDRMADEISSWGEQRFDERLEELCTGLSDAIRRWLLTWTDDDAVNAIMTSDFDEMVAAFALNLICATDPS